MRSANDPTLTTTSETTNDSKATAGSESGGDDANANVNIDIDVSGALGSDDGLDEAHLALKSGLDKRALEPVLLDVRGKCSYTNYLLLLSGRSDRQVEAICDGVLSTMRERGVRPLGTEGKQSGQWALLDFGDVIVHVFHHPMREHYDLEGLWIEAQRIELDIPEQAHVSVDDTD